MAAKGDDSGTNDLLREPNDDCENANSQDTKDEPNDPWYAKLEEKELNAEKPDVPTTDSKANGGTGRKKAVKKNENEGNGEPKAKRPYKRKVKTEDVDGQASAVPAKRGRKSSKIAPHDGADKDSNGVKSEESQPVEKKKRGRKPKVKDGEENNKEGQDSVDNTIGNGSRWSGEHRVQLADYVLSKLPQINWNEISPGLGGRNPSTVSKQWINLKKKFLELAQKLD